MIIIRKRANIFLTASVICTNNNLVADSAGNHSFKFQGSQLKLTHNSKIKILHTFTLKHVRM